MNAQNSFIFNGSKQKAAKSPWTNDAGETALYNPQYHTYMLMENLHGHRGITVDLHLLGTKRGGKFSILSFCLRNSLTGTAEALKLIMSSELACSYILNVIGCRKAGKND